MAHSQGPAFVWTAMAHLSLFTHRKLGKMCTILRISRPLAVGLLEHLWAAVIQDRSIGPDGKIGDWIATDLASAARWDRDPDEFAHALCIAGFVETNEGEFAIHDYADWCPEFVRKRWRQSGIGGRKCGLVGTSSDKSELVRPKDDNVTKRNVTKLKDKDTCAKKPAQARVRVDESQVETLWKACPPPKGSKKAALPHLRAALKKYPGEFDRILASVVRYAEAHRDGKYVKHAQRWFRDENFNDEVVAGGSHNGQAKQPPKEPLVVAEARQRFGDATIDEYSEFWHNLAKRVEDGELSMYVLRDFHGDANAFRNQLTKEH